MGTRPRLAVVGSTNIDLVVQVPHLPLPGETVSDGQFAQVNGGKGANTAVGAARAGADVVFVTATGSDAFGDSARTALSQDGIDLGHAVRVAGPTGIALILVAPDGQNSIAVAPGANDLLRPNHVQEAASALAASDMVLLQMEIPRDTLEATLAVAAENGVPVLLNYAPVRYLGLLPDPRITTLIVNEGEAAQLSGQLVDSPDTALVAAERLRELGLQTVVITLGVHGSVAIGPDFRGHVPAFPVEAIDATAAGDIFCGAFAVAISEGRPLPDALRFASAASAISVTRLGAQPSAPTRAEILGFLASRTV